MEKRNTAISILMIPILAALIGFGLTLRKTPKNAAQPGAAQEQDHTELYIINGDHEQNGWFDGPSKSEFLKAITERPEHLFITPSLWKSFCSHRAEQLKNLAKEKITASLENLEVTEANVYNKDNKSKSFSQNDKNFFNIATLVVFNEADWEFYDTHAGLYYLRPKNNIQNIGLKIDAFTKIEHPCELKVELTKTPWVDGFINLFDLTQWQQAHRSGKKKVVCISGHGTARQHVVSRVCGIAAEEFVKLMLFFNDSLKIDTLGVQSCYWPSARILELMATNNKPHLDCHLITPIDQEQVVHFAAEMPIVWSYEPTSRALKIQEEQSGEILLTGLHEIATSFNGTMTEELSEKLNQVQVVQLNHQYQMKTSLIDAGASQPIFI